MGYIDTKLSVESLNTLKLKGHILSNFKMTDHGFAYAKLTRKEVESFGVSYEDAAAQVSTISTIEDCPVWALFLEYSEEEIRVRLRSRGPVINCLQNNTMVVDMLKLVGPPLYNWDELEGFVNKADELVKKYKISEVGFNMIKYVGVNDHQVDLFEGQYKSS